MSDTNQPNMHLCDTPDRRCFTCKNVRHDSELRAFCMHGQPAGSAPPEQGRRVNENFVCDAFDPK